MNTLKFGNGEWYGKKGTILAYNDLNSNYKPLPFNFSRASSATVINKDGLIETVGSGIPRIDYKDDSKGALLLEPSRTNIWTNSNLFGSITLDGLTRTLNQSVSPSGDSDATLFNETATTGTHRFYRLDIPSTSTDFSMSFFAKKNGINIIRIVAQGGTKYADFDLSVGTVGNESGINSSAIEDYGNGWYRCVINVTATGWVGLYALNDSSQNSYLGNVSKGVYLYGASLEQGSYATSYIPTQGSAVTRLEDNIDTDFGTILPLSGEVSVYMEMLGQPVNGIANTGKTTSVSFDDTDANSSYVSLNFNGSYWRARVQGASGSNFNSLEVDQTETIKALFVLRPTSYALYANGNLIGSETRSYNVTAPTISEIAKVEFDNSTSDRGITRNKDLRVYNTALSNAEAIALTQV